MFNSHTKYNKIISNHWCVISKDRRGLLFNAPCRLCSTYDMYRTCATYS